MSMSIKIKWETFGAIPMTIYQSIQNFFNILKNSKGPQNKSFTTDESTYRVIFIVAFKLCKW